LSAASGANHLPGSVCDFRGRQLGVRFSLGPLGGPLPLQEVNLGDVVHVIVGDLRVGRLLQVRSGLFRVAGGLEIEAEIEVGVHTCGRGVGPFRCLEDGCFGTASRVEGIDLGHGNAVVL
jgi:hypothetical protein